MPLSDWEPGVYAGCSWPCFGRDRRGTAGGTACGHGGSMPGGKPAAGGFAGSLPIWGRRVYTPVLSGGNGYDRGGRKRGRGDHYLWGGGTDRHAAGDGADHGNRPEV